MLYAPPPRVTGTLVASLPDELRTGDPQSGLNANQPSGLVATSFLEGPSFDRDGVFWCVDIVNGRLLTLDTDGQIRIAYQYDGWPNGLKIHQDGRIFVADHKHGIMIYDRQRQRIEPLLQEYGSARFKGVNDLFFAGNGDLYFTDQGSTGLHDPTGRLFRLSADGRLNCLLDNLPSPNGLTMDLQERTLFLAITRDNSVWRVPLGRDFQPLKVGRFVQMSGGIGPDGLALSAQGELLVAHAGLGCIWLFSAEGEPLRRIDAPQGKLVTNLAFRDCAAEIYFIESSSGSIYKAAMPGLGKPMFSHAPLIA
ncbi:SMP-30/gluconolactonase/LRE family protein [Bordetella tumulicola]|uniref:SMP-30/gluconolactonase/LRE family protein n=1 Tax=Bordetella tumulicola TaxID=1649133 RepID=UPI0039F0DA05